MADQSGPELPHRREVASHIANFDEPGVSYAGGAALEESALGLSENTNRNIFDRMANESPEAGLAVSAELGCSASESIQQPLQRLRELDRLELERQRDEVRSLRGELRRVPAGQHSRYREEQEAQEELMRALRELLDKSDEKDRFTLETLLRAVEAGQRNSTSSSSYDYVREAADQIGVKGKAVGSRQPGRQDGLPAKLVVVVVAASIAITARKVRLKSRLGQACGAVKNWWNLLWCRHLADLISMAESRQQQAVGTARQVLNGLGSQQRKKHEDCASSSVSDCSSDGLCGYNTGIHKSRNLWLRPWRWFGLGRGMKAVPQMLPPPPLAPPASLAVISSPAKASLYGMTNMNRMPALPPRHRHSMDPAAFQTALSHPGRQWQSMQPSWQPRNVVGVEQLGPSDVPSGLPRRSTLDADELVTAPRSLTHVASSGSSGSSGEGFSFRTYVEDESSALRGTSSEGDLGLCAQGCESTGDGSPPTSATPSFNFEAYVAANRMKADFLTARTTSFRELQQKYSQPAIQSSSCNAFHSVAGPDSVSTDVEVRFLPARDGRPALPQLVSSEAFAGGVSFRATVDNAAELVTTPSVVPKSSSAQAFFSSVQSTY